MTLRIVPLTATDDLAEIETLAAEIWGEHYPGIISWAQVHYMLERGYRRDVIAEEVRSGVRWVVARDGDTSCGFAAFREQQPDRARLDKLYVAASHRGRGVARRLLAELVRWSAARGLRHVDLTVNKGNVDSIAAYLRLGFEFEARSVADIGHGFVMDDYVMGRPITGLA